jgi:hypothetical protein
MAVCALQRFLQRKAPLLNRHENKENDTQIQTASEASQNQSH